MMRDKWTLFVCLYRCGTLSPFNITSSSLYFYTGPLVEYDLRTKGRFTRHRFRPTVLDFRGSHFAEFRETCPASPSEARLPSISHLVQSASYIRKNLDHFFSPTNTEISTCCFKLAALFLFPALGWC